MSPNPVTTEGESSAQHKSIVIRLHLPPRRHDLETPILTAAKIDVTNLHETEEELAGDEFELRRREKGKGIEETRNTPSPTPIRSLRTHIDHLSTDKETL
ncbi:hypothetical protein Tco_1207950 [Tanacetum coccineum]